MKGFILKPHEAQALAAGKPVVIWRLCPFPVGVPLFGKETWRGVEKGDFHNLIRYKTDGAEVMYPPCNRRFWQVGDMSRWRSPSHLPEWASRITLTLSDVKVRRPCDVTEEEAKAMGILKYPWLATSFNPYTRQLETDDRHCRRVFGEIFRTQYGDAAWKLYHFTALATPQPKNS